MSDKKPIDKLAVFLVTFIGARIVWECAKIGLYIWLGFIVWEMVN